MAKDVGSRRPINKQTVCRRDRRRPLNPSPITSPPTCNLLLLYYSTSTVVPSRWVPGAARRAEGGDWLRPPRPTSRSSPAAGGPRRRPPAGGGGGRCGTPSCRLGSYRMCDRDRRRSGCGGGLCYSTGVCILDSMHRVLCCCCCCFCCRG